MAKKVQGQNLFWYGREKREEEGNKKYGIQNMGAGLIGKLILYYYIY